MSVRASGSVSGSVSCSSSRFFITWYSDAIFSATVCVIFVFVWSFSDHSAIAIASFSSVLIIHFFIFVFPRGVSERFDRLGMAEKLGRLVVLRGELFQVTTHDFPAEARQELTPLSRVGHYWLDSCDRIRRRGVHGCERSGTQPICRLGEFGTDRGIIAL